MKTSLEWVKELFPKYVGEYMRIVEKKCWFDVTLMSGEHVGVTFVVNSDNPVSSAYKFIVALSGDVLYAHRGHGIKKVYGFAVNKSRTEYVSEYGLRELTKINLMELHGIDPIHIFMIGSPEV